MSGGRTGAEVSAAAGNGARGTLAAAGARAAPMLESSLDEVVRAERELYEFPWTRGNFKDSIAAGYSCLELRSERRLVGYAVMMFGPGEAHILNLSIVAAMQRHGFGSALLGLLVEFARVRGASRIFLEVRPSNFSARQLYERAGFQMTGVRSGYYPARKGREDALLLERDL